MSSQFLISKRTIYRGKVTTIINEATGALADVDKCSIADLSILLDRLTLANTELNAINNQIETAMPESVTEAEISKTIDYSDKAVTCVSRIKSAISAKNACATSSSPVSISQTTEPPNTLPATAASSFGFRGNLKIELQPFHGKSREWLPFWEQFEALVDSDPNCPTVTKFALLRQSLRGSALHALSGLPPTGQNYSTAVQLLKKRFGDTQSLIQEHVAYLNSLPVCSSAEDIFTLRKIHSLATTNYRALQTLGMDTVTLGTLLFAGLTRALPRDVLFRFHRAPNVACNSPIPPSSSSCASDATATSTSYSSSGLALLEFLGEDLTCLERFRKECATKPSNGSNKYDKPSAQPPRKSSASSLHITGGQKKCVICQSTAHATDVCDSNLSITERKARLKNRCYKCTWYGHSSRDCKRKIQCQKCKGRHATAMCEPSASSRAPTNETATETPQQETSSSHVSGAFRGVLLQTASIWAKGENPSPVIIRALLDGGSERSFISAAAAQKMGCKVLGEESLTLHAFGTSTGHKSYKRVHVQVWSRNGGKVARHSIEALVVPRISNRVLPCPPSVPELPASFRKLTFAECGVADQLQRPTELLIGTDYIWQLTTDKVQRDRRSSLVAVDTVFGWTLHGALGAVVGISANAHVNNICVDEHDLRGTLSTLWELEQDGASSSQNMSEAAFDPTAFCKSSIVKVENRFRSSLPWKPSPVLTDNNYVNARQRLSAQVRKLQRQPAHLLAYDNVIREYDREGVIEPCTETEPSTTREYYMPHRHVLRTESATTPLRIVFDASSCKAGVPSLNDCLYTGPNWNQSLVSVLLNFRRFPVAMTADISKAFLQIEIDPLDRDSLKFIWFSSIPGQDSPLPPTRIYRFCRLPFGLTSSPFILAAAIRRHLDEQRETSPEIVDLLEHSFYVDDFLISVESHEQAVTVFNQSCAIMNEANFPLVKWTTNNPALRDHIASAARLSSVSTLAITPSSELFKVLGLTWEPNNDEFTFNLSQTIAYVKQRIDTKRFVLQASARIFDPLGFLSPYLLRVKLMFQELWKAGVNWDDALPENILMMWVQWCSEMHHLTEIAIPRCYERFTGSLEYELHIFSDASPTAYGAVAYLRIFSNADEATVSLLMSKSRVCPLKQKLTIPRLELTACVMSARLARVLQSDLRLPIRSTTFWTDSKIALGWINDKSNNWKPYVSNRIGEILETSSASQWRHISGKDNPADAVTRGLSAQSLVASDAWWSGPAFLRSPDSFSHELASSKLSTPDDLASVSNERRANPTDDECVCNLNVVTAAPPTSFTDCAKFGSLSRALRTTALCQRFVNNRYSVLQGKHENQRFGAVTAEELNDAERYWIKRLQEECFPGVRLALEREGVLPNTHPLARYRLFVDENQLIRVRTRLEEFQALHDTRNPILLPKEHHFVTLIVRDAHLRFMHSGVNAVMTCLRERFFIPQMRSLVRKVLRLCITCQRFHARPRVPPVAPLPACRIKEGKPFETTGIDFCGPVHLSDKSKAYICVFTCATTRMLHLELVTDLKTSTFLLALRRFIARRGICANIITDNARTFKRAEKDIYRLYRKVKANPSVNEYLGQNRISWRFNVPLAPWHGGFFERLVQSVKLALKKVLGLALLSLDEMSTTLCEVEATLNSRPLTYVEGDDGCLQPITPADLFCGYRPTSLPDASPRVVSQDINRKEIIKRYNYRQRLLSGFWKKWRDEYLLRLRSAHMSEPGRLTTAKVGDVVIVHDQAAPRLHWKLARVVKTHTGRDGIIRSVDLKYGTSTNVFKRPVQHISPLEISESP